MYNIININLRGTRGEVPQLVRRRVLAGDYVANALLRFCQRDDLPNEEVKHSRTPFIDLDGSYFYPQFQDRSPSA